MPRQRARARARRGVVSPRTGGFTILGYPRRARRGAKIVNPPVCAARRDRRVMHPVPLTIRICYMYRYLGTTLNHASFYEVRYQRVCHYLLALGPALGWPWPLRCRMALRGPLL